MSRLKILQEAGRRLLGNSTLLSRAGKGLGYLAAGGLSSAYIEHVAAEKKNYYGEDRYNARYGNAAETLSSTAKLAGMWYAGWSAVGRDPLSRIGGNFKYNKAKIENLLDSKGVSRAEKRLNARAHKIRSRENRFETISKDNVDQSGRAYRWRPPHVNEAGLRDRIASRTHPRSGRHSSDHINNLSQIPRLGFRHAAYYGAMSGVLPGDAWTVGAGIDLLRMSKGMGKSMIFTPQAAATTKSANISANWIGVAKNIGTTVATIGIGGYAGYEAAMANNNPIAEGTITQFERHNSSGVNRMNFSTAGLVQALHNNNRKY